MREHSFTESHDSLAPEAHRRGVPGRMAVTSHLAPRPVMRSATGPAPVAAPAVEPFAPDAANASTAAAAPATPSFEDPFSLHLAGEALDRAASGPSSALPAPLRDQFSATLGRDLAGVRLHTDETAAAAATAFSAKALTVGDDIYFAAGAYDPSSAHGQHLLAHEVAHTAQQAAAPAAGALTVSSPGDACEVEADRAADAMLASPGASLDAPSVDSAITLSPTAAVGRVVMRSPDDGAGGSPSFLREQAEREAEERGDDGGARGAPSATDPVKEAADRAEQERRAAREELAAQEFHWLGAADGGAPIDLDSGAPLAAGGNVACPPSVVDPSIAPEWYSAFASSWDEVEGIHGGALKQVQSYLSAAQRAKELSLSKDADNTKTAGWDPPKDRGLNLEKYAEEQGVADGPKVGDMWRDGKFDAGNNDVARGKAGYAEADQEAITKALRERQSSLNEVSKASLQFEEMTRTTARTKLIDIQIKDVAIDKLTLTKNQTEDEAKINKLNNEKDRLNNQISAAVSVVDGVLSFISLKHAEAGAGAAAAGDALKATAGVATNLINLEYGGKIQAISQAIDRIKIGQVEADIKVALLEKEKMLLEYQNWLKTEYLNQSIAVRDKFGLYKEAHNKAAAAFRAAAVNKVKAEQKERDDAKTPVDKAKMTDAERVKARDQAKADEAAQKAAGDKAEAVMRALGVIDTVIGTTSAGAAACREPGYSRDSGIGFTMAGSPQVIIDRVSAIRSFRAGFQLVADRWKARRVDIAAIVDGHAY